MQGAVSPMLDKYNAAIASKASLAVSKANTDEGTTPKAS